MLCETSPLEAALDYASRGWQVFPLHGIAEDRCTCSRRDCSSPGKHPLVRRGLHEATTDLDTIEEWWRRRPLANIGIATGAKSGIVVMDIDLPRALSSLGKLIHKLPSTLTGFTGGGGLHLIYRGNCEHLRCTTSQVPGIGQLSGMDLRANGGYIVAPPSMHISGNHYSWLELAASDEVQHVNENHERNHDQERSDHPVRHLATLPTPEIAPAPEWLKQPPRLCRPIAPSAPRFTTGAGTAYGLAVLRNQLEILRSAQVGERNHTLNRCAFIVARFVNEGHLSEGFARSELHRVALLIGLTDWETTRTITSAFRASTFSPK